jgi:hypothetical protein
MNSAGILEKPTKDKVNISYSLVGNSCGTVLDKKLKSLITLLRLSEL